MGGKEPNRGAPLFRSEPQAEVGEELAFHIEERVRANIEAGMDPETASAAALARFGDVESVRHQCADLLAAERREERRRDWFGDLAQDVRFGVRGAVRAPLFSLLAIVTLALGIGANAAVFGVVKSVLLDSLPYEDASRLVRIHTRWESAPGERQSVSPGVASDFGERLRSFTSVAFFNFTTFDATYVDESAPRLLPGALVSSNFLETLGVSAAVGRTFNDGDPGTPVIMLSHEAWQREFGGDRGVIGTSPWVAGSAREVIGVLPRGFVGPMGAADLWFPLNLEPALAELSTARGQHWLGVVGRLAPGVRADAAQQEIDRVAADLTREYPESDRGRSFVLVPLREDMAGETRTPLLVLMASAGLVLLITCANLAGALLSRTISRRKEFAVRVALGAGRGRLVRQLLTESSLIAVAGAAAGLLLAGFGLAAVRGLATGALPAHASLSLDTGVVLVTVVAALLTGIAFGLAPALAAGRRDTQGTLREQARGSGESRRSRQLRGTLVAGQIALSVSLLVGAGLLVRSLLAMTAAPLGFEPEGVLTARVDLPQATYPMAERTLFFQQLEERLAALPGVTTVASVSQIPSPTMSSNVLTVEGETLPGDGPTFIPYMTVSDDFFRTMGIQRVAGRTFGPEDTEATQPSIVVSETMARRYWPDGDAVGKRLRVSPHTAENWGTVIGIVRDVRVDPLLPVAGPIAYATYRQDMFWSGRDFLLRTQGGDPLKLMRPFQQTLASMDPTLPLRHPRALDDIVAERMAGRRLPVVLMTAFGVLALLLASVGIYAMFATQAAAREREFGVRMALGSSRRGIAALILRQGAAWMALGLVGGAVGIALVGRFLSGLLYGVEPLDPLTVAAAVAVLLACAAAALLVPIRRATRADPASILQ